MTPRYAALRAADRCYRCRGPAGGFYACAACREVLGQRWRRYREERKARGECLCCGGQSRPNRIYCAECAQYRSVITSEYAKAKRRAA